MATNGNNILVYLGGTAIAGLKSNEIETSCGEIEISSPNSAAWREFIADRKEWSVSTGYLVSAVSDISQVLNVGTTYSLRFCGRTGTGGVYGSAILTKCSITATRGNLVQGSFTFRGTGTLAQ